MMILISFHGIFANCLCGKYIRYLVIIYVDQLPAVGGSSVSSTSDWRFFSGGQLSIRECRPRKIFFPIYLPLLLIVKGSTFVKILGILTDQVWFQSPGFSYSCDAIFSVWFCYDQQYVVFLLRHFILQSYFCVFSEFEFADDVLLSRKLIQRAIASLSFIMILISCFCYFQPSVFEY